MAQKREKVKEQKKTMTKKTKRKYTTGCEWFNVLRMTTMFAGHVYQPVWFQTCWSATVLIKWVKMFPRLFLSFSDPHSLVSTPWLLRKYTPKWVSPFQRRELTLCLLCDNPLLRGWGGWRCEVLLVVFIFRGGYRREIRSIRRKYI